MDHQFSRLPGAIPVPIPILRRLRVAQAVDVQGPGDQQVGHGTASEILKDRRSSVPDTGPTSDAPQTLRPPTCTKARFPV